MTKPFTASLPKPKLAPALQAYSEGEKTYALKMFVRLQKSIELSTHQRGPCVFKNTFVAAELTDRILQISDQVGYCQPKLAKPKGKQS